MSHVLIRSGETDFDVEGRLQGTIDLPLTAHGRAEVDAAAEELRSIAVEVIYCSPGEPAFSTARVIGRALGIAVKPLKELDNMHFGLWQGMRLEEIRHKHPKVFRQWQETPSCVCPPEGETIEDVTERVIAALRKPLKRGTPFAVVAPEPLATLVGGILRGEEPQLGHPAVRPETLVEVIDAPVGVAETAAKGHNSKVFRGFTFGLM
jgi:probable phosphoglycerate mutase